MNEIKTFKINSTGEEVIGKMVYEDKSVICVEQPKTLVYQESGAGLAPFMLTADTTKPVTIMLNHVTAIATPSSDIEKSYIESTTGLFIMNK